MLDRVEEVLGTERAARFHSHFSRIEFTQRGRKTPPYLCRPRGLWAGLDAAGRGKWPAGGGAPPSSAKAQGTQAEDALEMKRIYQGLCSSEEA